MNENKTIGTLADVLNSSTRLDLPAPAAGT